MSGVNGSGGDGETIDNDGHTIVLLQVSNDMSTKQYSDFNDIGKAVDAVIQLYEVRLKQLHPNEKQITYDISQLYDYIDSLTDLACLVYDANLMAYVPHNKQWIKKAILDHLKAQA
eukprot:TRINITY_DN66358_c7_g6_i1.p1 TRINITY_DN66358_c7_g6~~TRINITY_DN66358_c7_g6_i1.p1  ORF type:complete len:126 (+),score=61.01 TRINITY_DN66358_c7_g6_i1:31-378(+)